MSETALQDNQALISFWDKAFAMTEDEQRRLQARNAESWKELAPSEKLFRAASSLGQRKKVLDYGCGSAWASVIAAKSGCTDVTAADPAPGAVRAARFHACLYGAEDRIHAICTAADWLRSVPDGTFDGFICSNVLDVVPPETAEEIIRQSARITTPDADVIIGLNYCLEPETAVARGLELKNGNRLYIDGILRLVSRSDEEWRQIFLPWYAVERLDHFAWPGEATEARRLFRLRRRSME